MSNITLPGILLTFAQLLTSRFVMIIIIVVVVGGPLQGEMFRPYQSACHLLPALNICRSQRHFLLRDWLYAYSKIWFNPPFIWKCPYQVRAIAVFPVFRLLTDFVSLLTYEFCLSLWKIARCSIILLLPYFTKWLLFNAKCCKAKCSDHINQLAICFRH
jgi:hypothetical protein